MFCHSHPSVERLAKMKEWKIETSPCNMLRLRDRYPIQTASMVGG